MNDSSATVIGAFGSYGAATDIRIGPDGRLYANAFNAGEMWRSDVGITNMGSSAYIAGLSSPASLYFAAIPEPDVVTLMAPVLLRLMWIGRKRRE